MMRLPRTATGPRKAPASQPPAATHGQGSEGSQSPVDVLQGPWTRSGQRAPAAAPRKKAAQPARMEGHAQDIVHLLDAGWFGAQRPGGESADEEPEIVPPLPPLRRGRRQQQHAGEGGQRDADASPTTSGSHRSGSAAGSAGGSQASGGSALPRATLPQPILSVHQAQQAAAVQDLPGIGTWAGRYRLFGREKPPADQPAPGQQQQQQQQQQAEAQQPDSARKREAEEAYDQFGSPVVLGAGGWELGAPAGRRSSGGSYGSEQACEDAWRWRFSRKWATEQKKYYDGGDPTSMASDDLDPLAFTQACGIGVGLQLLQTSAPRQRPVLSEAAGLEGVQPRGLETSVSNLSLLTDEASYQPGLLGAEMSPGPSTHGAGAARQLLQRTTSSGSAAPSDPGGEAQQAQPRRPRRSNTWAAQGTSSPRNGLAATRSVLTLANKAQDLLQKQRAIEQAEQDRWDRSRTAGDAWAGRRLEAARIDMRGRFKFCVLRVSDGGGHTRFVVRGRVGATSATLLAEVKAEAAAASRSTGASAATVEVVGDGVMEWREDTERHLHVMPSTLPGDGAGSGSPTATASFLGDVCGLAASLARQALPCHFRITTAASAGRSSSMAALNNRI